MIHPLILRFAPILAFLFASLVAWVPSAGAEHSANSTGPTLTFEVTLPPSLADKPVTGRLFLYVGKGADAEPRRQSNTSLFAQGVKDWKPGDKVVLGPETPGDPTNTLGDLPAGDYTVQALLNVYTDFHRSDGHVIWAHMDQWEGQNFAVSPGNLVSSPQTIHVGPGVSAAIPIELQRKLPPVEIPADTEWVQRIKFESPMLSRFWGRPIFLGATILLPKGYATHTQSRYPVVYVQGHFSLAAPFGFSPPQNEDGALPSDAASHKTSPAKGAVSKADARRDFYNAWTSDDFPRVIAVTFQHPTPYFDDSYGVNSPNCGPYGDAIMQELIPALESRYRTIPQGYARVLTGSSTGGWGSLAMQLYHPDFFGGAWAFSPDPVDFRLYYGGVNIYEEDNAFVEKPGQEFKGGGQSNRAGSHRAAILGMQEGRWEWWKHTPFGPDGTPLPVWDLATGKIDHAVAEEMRRNGFDLRDYLSRNWTTLGPKLVGKLHVCAAYTDSFYSNLAVHLLEQFMRETKDPHEEGTFHYGPPGSHHGWQPTTSAELLKEMSAHMARNAPDPGSNAQWHY